jgi:thiol-disulfide isomerase/thioredoxin
MMSMKRPLIRVCPILVLACLLAPPQAATQMRQRVVERATRLLTIPEPVEAVEVTAGGRVISVGQPFDADEDWLRGFTIKARNISQLPVTYAEFRLEVKPTGQGESVGLLLKYGRTPTGNPAAAEAAPRDAEVKPGEFFQLSLSARLYDYALKSLSGGGRKVSFERARISLGFVVFEGGRAWRNGSMIRRDDTDSRRWNVTDEELDFIKPVERMPRAGTRAPGFSVRALDGRDFELASMRGKVVVLNFWFIGCAPCRAEIPELNKLAKEYADKDVVFIAVAADGETDLRTFLKEVPFDYHVVPGGGEVMGRYGSAGFPRHVVIDKAGVVRWAKTGNVAKTGVEFKQAIDGALGGR